MISMKPRHKRVFTKTPLSWTANFQSTILNISAGGLYFRSTSPPETKSSIKLSFKLPGTNHTIATEALVHWVSSNSQESKQQPLYGVGVEFTDLAASDQAKLQEFVEKSKQEERKNRRHGSKLLVEYHFAGQNFRCMANDISRTGMFIVTTEPLQLEDMLNAKFTLPGSGERIKIRSIVRWRHVEIPTNLTSVIVPGMGIEFLTVSTEDQLVISEYINALDEQV
jgi:c-di-GMP-binding flagellar brake protein YcgR